ncbi:uncharacterized protein [Primulina huaijiensis]|uniref:uncharacterized protein n=1 Tax=Primulina huaijiensis TaxID=1492673 RepID=UPI003CC7377B
MLMKYEKRIAGDKMDEPVNRSFIEKWKNADALFATPTGSNDDWYELLVIVFTDNKMPFILHVIGYIVALEIDVYFRSQRRANGISPLHQKWGKRTKDYGYALRAQTRDWHS